MRMSETMALESGPVRASYWLRTLSPWPDPSVLTDEVIRLYLQPLLSSQQRMEAFQRRSAAQPLQHQEQRNRDGGCGEIGEDGCEPGAVFEEPPLDREKVRNRWR